MSTLRLPDEKSRVLPVVSTLLPPTLEALKKTFENELNRQCQILDKIMGNIRNTVEKMLNDPDEMWLHIDFQAEALDQIIHQFCQEVKKSLISMSPPDSIEEEEGINSLVSQLEWDLNQKYCAEDCVEKVLAEKEKLGPVAVAPTQLLASVSNPHIAKEMFEIAGFPGLALPTNAWWLPLAQMSSSGFYTMTVVADGTLIKDPLCFVMLSCATRFHPHAQIGEEVAIPSSTAFPPQVDQGCYLIKNNAHGFEFCQSEQFYQEGAKRYQSTPYSLVAGAQELLRYLPTVTSFDDHCVTLHAQQGASSITTPLLRGSPYITIQYRNCTPFLQVSGMQIDTHTLQAYGYFLVVADEKLSDAKTEISLSAASARGIAAQVGEVVLLPNLDHLEGQVFSFQIKQTNETYFVYSSTPLKFHTVHLAQKTVLPQGVNIPEGKTEQFALGSQELVPYSSLLEKVNDQLVNGLRADQLCEDLILRIAKVPASKTPEEVFSLLLHHAWVFATSSNFSITGKGSWKYSYSVHHINPLAHLKGIQLKKQDLLVALLTPDLNAINRIVPSTDIAYETLRGPAHFIVAADQELPFSQAHQILHWPDATLSNLSAEQKNALVESLISQASHFDIRSRGASTLKAAHQIQELAQASHIMYTLLRQNLDLIDNRLFMAAFQSALNIAKSGLDDYLVGGLLQYDNDNKMIISQLPADAATTVGEDHHRMFGYLINAAACIHDITPDWFKGKRKDVVNLLINDLCSPYEQNPHFPKLRMCDLYTGLSSKHLATTPHPFFVSTESLGEELNALLGIALWAKSNYNKQLEDYATTLAERLRNAAIYYQIPIHTQLPIIDFTPPLLFWKEKTDKWLHTPHLSAQAYKLAENLSKEIQTLIDYKGTLQDLHLWARTIQLPSILESYPGLSYQELYPFCVITQTNPFDANFNTELPMQAPDTSIFAENETGVGLVPQQLSIQADTHSQTIEEKPIVQPAPLFASSQLFTSIKAEITSYLSERTVNLYHAQTFLGLEQQIPSTDAEWRKLSSLAQFRLQQLQSDIASCRCPAHWTAVAAKYGFKGNLLQIQKQTAFALRILSDLFSARLALSYFIQALTKITTLEMADASLEDLSVWAHEFNTSGLTHHDLSVWKQMEI